MVVVNVHLKGNLEYFIERYIKAGYAASKAEVIRMALVQLMEKQDFEDISDDKELEIYLKNVALRKTKPKMRGPVRSAEELLV